MQVVPSSNANFPAGNIIVGSNANGKLLPSSTFGHHIVALQPQEAPTLVKKDTIDSKSIIPKNNIKTIQQAEALNSSTNSLPMTGTSLLNGSVSTSDSNRNLITKINCLPSQALPTVIVSSNNAVLPSVGATSLGKIGSLGAPLNSPEHINLVSPTKTDTRHISSNPIPSEYTSPINNHSKSNSVLVESKSHSSKKSKKRKRDKDESLSSSSEKIAKISIVNGGFKNESGADMPNITNQINSSNNNNNKLISCNKKSSANSMPMLVGSPLNSPSNNASSKTIISPTSANVTQPNVVFSTPQQMVLQPGQQVKQLFISPQNQEVNYITYR